MAVVSSQVNQVSHGVGPPAQGLRRSGNAQRERWCAPACAGSVRICARGARFDDARTASSSRYQYLGKSKKSSPSRLSTDPSATRSAMPNTPASTI
jgi:hypothetical protein